MFTAAGKSAAVSAANYIEDVFSTYLYTGTAATRTITNNIDLSTYGGMVWTKGRNYVVPAAIFDTVRGANQVLRTNSTNAQASPTDALTGFTSSGYTLGADASDWGVNYLTSYNYVSWTFRKQAKFFDVVTFTKNASTNQRISHNLGATPGCIMVKSTDAVGNWTVWHRSLASATDSYMILNSTGAASATANAWGSTGPTSTDFGVSSVQFTNGTNYVAYLFAHDAGGFGAAGADNVISCGGYTTTTGATQDITLGYEPQWVLIVRSSGAGAVTGWFMFDVLRQMSYLDDAYVQANATSAETTIGGSWIRPTPTGFTVSSSLNGGGTAGYNFIYIAIRRGPMKTPTSGTSVFSPVLVSQNDIQQTSGGTFPPDFVFMNSTNGSNRSPYVNQIADRLRSLGTPSDTFSTTTDGVTLTTSSTAIEDASNSYIQLKANGIDVTRGAGWNSAGYGNFIYYLMRRAPGFFDVVCYTGNGFTQNINHNLTVTPELIIVKCRSAIRNWVVYSSTLGNATLIYLDGTNASTSNPSTWNSTTPTTSVFSVGGDANTNSGSITYVAYLFATVAGVSKVGSYTGTGALQTINCGFAAGARFVLIKRTDSTGDWWVYDSARGITSGNDPYFFFNTTAADVTNTNYVDTASTGFQVTAAAPAGLNASGGTYIFLAIA